VIENAEKAETNLLHLSPPRSKGRHLLRAMSCLPTRTINESKLHWMDKVHCDDSVHTNSDPASYLVRDGTMPMDIVFTRLPCPPLSSHTYATCVSLGKRNLYVCLWSIRRRHGSRYQSASAFYRRFATETRLQRTWHSYGSSTRCRPPRFCRGLCHAFSSHYTGSSGHPAPCCWSSHHCKRMGTRVRMEGPSRRFLCCEGGSASHPCGLAVLNNIIRNPHLKRTSMCCG
jgi:hypothetical protein